MKAIPSLSLLILLASCGFNTSPDQMKKLDLVNSNVISIREVNAEVATFMVRLDAPALLESASYNGAHIQIDEGQKALVLSQQQQFVESIKKLDPSIQVLYSTKLVMNSVTIIAHPSIMGAVNQLPMVKNVREMSLFNSPSPVTLNNSKEALTKTIEDLTQKNSVSFIGAKEARESMGLTGKGLRIGILDTGIDYTHKMFGGSGSVEEYKGIDATKEVSMFPNDKIVGGIDLVGDLYSPGSPYKEHRIPKPDMNPLDYNGHGTHVAGTVAGHGDGVNTYDGVAPDSTMYAIKVFGQNSTGDAVVIAGLEYSVDPNGDLNPDDRMDIVNLSLGGPYGKPSINYAEAVKNIVKAGVSFVAAAGNSGSVPFIVGAPSTAVDAFSVAAGIDDMLHTTQVDAARVAIDGAEENIISVYGEFSKKLKEGEVVSGEIAYIGLANEALSPELAAQVQGKIALIDRGGEPFATKAGHALKAGAIGVAVANNNDEEPSSMVGDGELTIPAVMISKAQGQKLQGALKANKEVKFSFSTEYKFSRTEFIDTITGFSSRGPRSEDGIIKPEIVAPGQLITSAKAGGGEKAARLNGTSMASPHMAGVMALVKQRFPDLSVLDHKYILMSTAKIISDNKGVRYPVTSQGAGRVDVMKAVNAKVLPSRGSFSLGKVDLSRNEIKEQNITLTNLTSEDIEFMLKAELTPGLVLNETSRSFSIKAGGKLDLNLHFNLNLTDKDRSNYDGFIKLIDDSGKVMASFPVLAVVHQSSEISAVAVNQVEDKFSVTLKNNSSMKGTVLPFNLIDTDVRKPDLESLSHIRSRACDIKSAGYRFVTRTEKVKENDVEKEVKNAYLQMGIKLYESVSSWEACEVSVLIDSDNDGVAEQEWVASQAEVLPGLNKAIPNGFYSFLIDAKKARTLRDQYEIYQRLTQGDTVKKDEMRDTSETKNDEGKVEDYRKALLSLTTYKPYNQSSVSVMEIKLADLAKTEAGKIRFKMASIDTNESSTQPDDFLAGKDKWHSIDASESEIKMMTEEINLEANEKKKVELAKSESSKGIVLYSPTNSDGKRDESKDLQEIILK
ncbi:S8 family serine peptidase [Peredibacter starrii]|uniref:S8 family serine peptidase n=1 Tax=Peredibacter starrii TaxID=28202 RepID=A0AAX4HK65_9BACT|nr:S8 family serine peptidase [Peredibacter starrii]WPU63585.1 S8 family serine peptidase [Peredibacter starrii]